MTVIIPASIRNRNPGAAYPGPSSRKFGSISFETLRSKDGVHKIATFPSNIQGAAAMFHLLENGRDPLGRLRYRNRAVKDAIATWCGEFYLTTYIKVLEEKAGVNRSDIITQDLLRDPAKAIPLAQAMALQEAGRDYPMTAEEWSQAHACAFIEPVAPAFSPENDVPSPKAEMRTAAAVDTAAKGAGLATAAGTVATVALTPVPTLPAVPTVITGSLTNASAWQGVADQMVAFKSTIVAAPLTFTAIAVVCGALWFLPNLAAKLGGNQS
jgi:hypothetical protein